MKKLTCLGLVFLFILTSNLFAAGPGGTGGGGGSIASIPSIKVTSPNGGELWVLGNAQPFEVKWRSQNVGWVSIYILFEDGTPGYLLDAYGPKGKVTVWLGANAVFSNTSKTLVSGKYKIFITNLPDPMRTGPSISDQSDGWFDIKIKTTVSLPVPACRMVSLELYDLDLESFRVDGKKIRGMSVEFRTSAPREVSLEVIGCGVVFLETDTGWQWIAIVLTDGEVVVLPPLPAPPSEPVR